MIRKLNNETASDNQSVLLLSTAHEGLNGLSTIQQRQREFKSKSAVTYPKVVKLYNNGTESVDLIDQRTTS